MPLSLLSGSSKLIVYLLQAILQPFSFRANGSIAGYVTVKREEKSAIRDARDTKLLYDLPLYPITIIVGV